MKKPRSKRGFAYSVIHELAHYFLYSRDKRNYANKLYVKLQSKDILKNQGANEYGKSARFLKKHKVPLDKTCLEYIDKNLPNLPPRPIIG